MSFNNTGQVWDLDALQEHLDSASMTWASSVTFHHTAFPDLQMRPSGLKAAHLRNIRHYYENVKGWSAGPHLFIDEDQIWPMTPLGEPGVHARSFNMSSVGIEVLGNYDLDDPFTGRGLACWRLAAKAGAMVLERLGIPLNSNSVKFHRDDPRTSKTCPGSKVTKEWVINLMRDKSSPALPADEVKLLVEERIRNIEWQIKQLKLEIS